MAASANETEGTSSILEPIKTPKRPIPSPTTAVTIGIRPSRKELNVMDSTIKAMRTPITSDGPIIFISVNAEPVSSACQPEKRMASATAVMCSLDFFVTSAAGVL
ncbi:hypothetical protein D3C73_1408140 [compost metagenome]